MRSIVLTGTYSSSNKGDAAMQSVAANLAREQLGVEAVIACPFPARDGPYYAPHRVVRSGRRWLPIALAHLCVLLLVRLLGIRLRRYPLDAEINAMAKAECVVDLSGDMLTEDYGPLVAASHFMPLCQALALRKPLVICAQSIGPFRRLEGLARRVLARAAYVSAREAISADYLDGLGLKNASLTADMAFRLEPAPAERLREIRRAEGLDGMDAPMLGVSASALLGNRRNRHLPAAQGDLVAAFADALNAVARRHGLHVLLVSHVVGPGDAADDREISRRLAAHLDVPHTVLTGDYRPEEIKGLVGDCLAFVGCRMHANIAALDSGVPTLAISYSHKTEGIMSGLGLSQWVMPLPSLQAATLESELERLLASRDDYRGHLARTLPGQRALALQNFELIRRAMDPQGATT